MNRTVIVTGGAGGIGWEICKEFARQGDRVYCVDKNRTRAEMLCSQLGNVDIEQYCGSIYPIGADVSLAESAHYAVEFAKSLCRGKIDVLINNVGIQPLESYVPLHELKEEVWDRIFAVNLKSFFLMSKYCIPHMRYGNLIINMASVTALAGAKNIAAYATTKAAIVGLTKQMAMDYAEHGIRVNAVCPGTIDTPLVRKTLETQTGGKDAASAFKALAHAHPIGRIGLPEEVARAVKFFASDDASFITGAVLAVDGGLSAKGAWAIEK